MESDRRKVAEIADFVDEALQIVELADQEGILLRIMGSIAVKLHCGEHDHIHDALKREITDIDFMTSARNRGRLRTFLGSLGLVPNERFNYFHGDSRHIYFDSRKRTVDIFFDKLEMNHTVKFENRLQFDKPTVPLAELLMSKMQVVKINEKDIKDTIVLLREHVVGDGDKETINSGYIAKLLSGDWGFYHTFMINLDKVKDYSRKYVQEVQELTEADIGIVADKILRIRDRIDAEPKNLGWRMRSKIGEKKRWYTEVEEIER